MMKGTNNLIFVVILLNLTLVQIYCHKSQYKAQNILDPVVLRPFMFTTQITGSLNILRPTTQKINLRGNIVEEEYVIEMKKTTQQLLPPQKFNKTTIYAYAGQTNSGQIASFPGPAVMATRDVPIKIRWRNLIEGKHILPVDYNYPFQSSNAFRNQVPTVPHVHGVATSSNSDGQPEAYWTITGSKTQNFNTLLPSANNEAVFEYPNQQEASNNWYHDHTMGITRLNVYAGLAGFYKISDFTSIQQLQIVQKHGFEVNQNQTKYLIVTDKSFTTTGQLFYPNYTENPNFSSWVPEFFGNTILVNGVVWPKMSLKRGKYRFVLLNACQNRFLNIFFQNSNKKLPIQLIRIDGDYYDEQIVVTQIMATIASRIQFIVDFSLLKGQVILKNNAAAPYPNGDPQYLVPEFTGQIMKFIIEVANNSHSSIDETILKNQQKHNEILKIDHKKKLGDLNLNKEMFQKLNKFKKKHEDPFYPTFSEGEKVFTTLFEVMEDEMVSAMFIDGISMSKSKQCQNSTYQIGKTYDFYVINLTPDTHPIHFHLVNMQKVKQFKFDADGYEEKYFQINGGVPSIKGWSQPAISLDPEEFRIDEDEYPLPYQKVFRDTIDCQPHYVTVLRIHFNKNDGSEYKTIDLRGQRYVFHCHMLEHEDNEMMKYYCLK